MKVFKCLLTLGLVVIFAQVSFAQQRLGGKVIDIINGKTAIVEVSDGKKITVQLEFIEVPEPEQPLSQIVNEHLKTLLLGKNVELVIKTIMPTYVVGKIYLGEVNISQQMLRDGAAWYAIPEKYRQNEFESRNFQIVEAQAKLEKRGVWGIENLKPAWEFRAEKEELRKQKENNPQANYVKDPPETVIPQKTVTKNQFPNWIQNDGQKYDSTNRIGNLLVGYSSQEKVGFVTTPQFNFEITDQKNSQKVSLSITYFYKETEKKGKESYYLVAVESATNDFKFLKTDDLLVIADGQKINLGKAQRLTNKENTTVKEILTYKIKRNIVDKVAYAPKVDFKVGSYAGKLDNNLQSLIKTLLNAAQ
jgi:micrococcal nuclease